jgi:hypothetical protein
MAAGLRGKAKPLLLLLTSLTVAILVVTVLLNISSSGRPASFWVGLAPREAGPTGELIYTSLEEITPDGPGAKGLLPADVIVRGTIQSIEPGIAFSSGGDALHSPMVGFDDPEAVIRWGRLVMTVDDVLAGSLPSGAKSLSIAWQVPKEAVLADINKSAASAGTGIFFLSPAAERLRRTGKAIADESYYSSVYLVVGGAAFVEPDAASGLSTPLLEEGDRETLLGNANSLSDVVALLEKGSVSPEGVRVQSS